MNDLIVGKKYSYAGEENTFEIIGKHGSNIWVLWCDDGEIETLYVDCTNKKLIVPCK